MLSPPAGSINDPVMFIPQFRETHLVPSLRYTLRDLLITLNVIEASGDEPLDQKLLRAEFMGVPENEIREQATLAKEVKDLLQSLCDEMNKKMGGANILDMSALNREVDQMLKFYNSCMAAVSPAEEKNETDETAPATNSGSAASVFTDPALLSYKVTSRAQAVLMLKKGAEYFQTQEPNSPIPILVSRALRFSEMSFIELIEDIMPDALPRGRDILGIKPEAKGASA
jgi:hypothetical protein